MIEVVTSGGLQRVTLNRPDKRNALTRQMLDDLLAAVSDAGVDPDVKALVLTGAGAVFSAGADLDEARAGLATDPIWNTLSDAIAEVPVLTIAALNGTAAGGSLGMVLAADLVIAGPDATVFYPVMKLGFLPQSRDVARLVARAGQARAARILMAGARLSAEKAECFGLVDQVAKDVLAASQDAAADALVADREHVMAIKTMIRSAHG